MSILRREFAPIIPEAWNHIEEEARRVLALNLAGRKLVDFEGPLGWECAAVNLGRLHLLDDHIVPEVSAGVRQVQPLLELRIPFLLSQMELDSIGRGAEDADFAPLEEAAQHLAMAEDRLMFHGYEKVGIQGMVESSPHKALDMPAKGKDFFPLVVKGIQTLHQNKVGGPYALALGPKPYGTLMASIMDGHRTLDRVQSILEGPVVQAPALEDQGVLLSIRGGDFALTCGQDISIGYAHHDKDTVELYFTETLTFRTIEPAAALALR